MLESCPLSDITPCICCFANLSIFSRENSKSAGLVNAYMDSQKLDAINTLRAIQLAATDLRLSQNGHRSNLRASKFPGGPCPQAPLVLHA